MGKNSSIEWTDHTFNPWWGCTKVSAACDHCYAEAWARRVGADVWGKDAKRRFFTPKHWAEPLKWNAEAEATKHRRRVFCASMSDVFEPLRDLNSERDRLWELINKTPWLDWLLLTKRPGNILCSVPWTDQWPENVWIGTTVENQKWAEKRLPLLLRHPAKRRFLSCEPLLGEIDLTQWITEKSLYPIDWVIAGGESGAHARPMHPRWPQMLRNQCRDAKIPFHFKQWGNWAPSLSKDSDTETSNLLIVRDEKSGDDVSMIRRGKKISGRLLDGKNWDEIPSPIL